MLGLLSAPQGPCLVFRGCLSRCEFVLKAIPRRQWYPDSTVGAEKAEGLERFIHSEASQGFCGSFQLSPLEKLFSDLNEHSSQCRACQIQVTGLHPQTCRVSGSQAGLRVCVSPRSPGDGVARPASDHTGWISKPTAITSC